MQIKEPKQIVMALQKHGSLKAVSRASQMSYRQVRKLYKQAVERGLMEPLPKGTLTRERAKNVEIGGKIHGRKFTRFPFPKNGEVKRYIFTCAQNNTRIHEKVWENLEALASHYNADIHVARFLYVKNGLGIRNAKETKKIESTPNDLWWDERIVPYLLDERVEIAPGLIWCGELNILPTATNPFSGLEIYTGIQSSIIPHAKIQMQSISTSKYEDTKFNYTTGTITQRNYIQRKTGMKAEFHHCYGGLLVEVDSDGDWFVRQLNAADSNGVIYDLNLKVENGKVNTKSQPLAILHGDIHCSYLEPKIKEVVWGKKGLVDTLKPQEQHFGDIIDFCSRSHHNDKNPHQKFKVMLEGIHNISVEIVAAYEFLKETKRSFSKSVVIDSNHHHHLGKWLLDKNGLHDPPNAEFWLKMHSRIYGAMAKKKAYNYLVEALKVVLLPEQWNDIKDIKFLNEDESYVVGGIQCGMHGDLGPGGTRGNIRSFAKIGRKANIGHSHVAGIFDGIYQCGTYSQLDMNYVRGPSAWSHSLIITHPNGKRQIITIYNGKWRI